jgi:hypothetical protein
MKRTAITFGLAATLCGCSSELDINAPYKDITIVYGLLDSRDPIQFIKVNKAFLGEGDAYVFAQIPDSNEWGDAVGYARVHRKLNGQVVATFDLRDTLITNREPGDFYSPLPTIVLLRGSVPDHDPGGWFFYHFVSGQG